MADLPRYQSSGTLFADVPRLDFASSREQARGLQNMSTSLDRISEFAFKKVAQDKIREGEQWGYNKEISAAQIEAASRGEADIAADLPKAGTFFGDAARKAVAGQLRARLELASRSHMSQILMLVGTGEITSINQLDKEFSGLAKGFGDVIAKLDPDQANAFRASVATASKQVYDSAVGKIVGMHTKLMEEEANAAVSNSSVIVQSAIENNTDPVMLQKTIALERQRVLTAAAATRNPEFFESKRKEFEAAIRNSTINVVSNYLLSDQFADDFLPAGIVEVGDISRKDLNNQTKKPVIPSIMKPTNADILRAVSEGKVGKYKAVWATLDSETRMKVEDELNKRMGNAAKAKREEEQDQKEANKRRGIELREDFYRGKKSNIERDQLIADLKLLDDIGREELEAMFDPQKKVWNNARLLSDTESKLDKGQVGEAYVEQLAKDGKISWEDATRLRSNARNQSRQMVSAKEYIKASIVGIAGPFNVSEEKARLAGDLTKQLAEAEYAALQAGKPFDPMAVAQSLVKSKKSEVDDQRSAEDKAALEKALKDSGANLQYRTDYTDETLKRAGVDNPEKRKRILRRQKAVTGEQ